MIASAGSFYSLALRIRKKRRRNLRSFHELYCFGHLTEAAVAYYQATGKDRLLQAACRFADCIAARIGEGPDQIPGVPGHEIAEMALAGLYEATGSRKYLDLGRVFINQRGQAPNYFAAEQAQDLSFPLSSSLNRVDEKTGQRVPFSYQQADRPVREQTEAEVISRRGRPLSQVQASRAAGDRDHIHPILRMGEPRGK